MASFNEVNANRLLPADPSLRSIARELYDSVRELPILSPHGHVAPSLLVENQPFGNPTNLMLTPDHYVNRLMHAQGLNLGELGVAAGELDDATARKVWRTFCTNWPIYRGTPVKYWFESQFHDIFDVSTDISAATADTLFDALSEKLASPEFLPRALFQKFNLKLLATTDDPCDTLAEHATLAANPSWVNGALIAPTFRPDRYLEPLFATWNADRERLGAVAGCDTSTYSGFTAALVARRQYFKAAGAVSTDHSHADVWMSDLGTARASELFARAVAGTITPDEAIALRRQFMFDQARMATEDGLVMTLHPGVIRNHHTPTHESFGADVGCDIPLPVSWAQPLREALNAFGTHSNFTLILFTLDETGFSREIATLAGFYPSVYVGAPWWFLDAPEAIRRFRSATFETVGFSKTSGFIDDTRAFCTIPARHDMSRRLDSGVLAQLVAEHRISMGEALDLSREIVIDQPIRAFKLPAGFKESL